MRVCGFGVVFGMKIDQELQNNYLQWTESALADMRTHHANLSRNPDDSKVIQDIFAIAHNIKGMGASFGFPLMTETGVSFCRYIRSLDGRPVEVDVIDAHIRSLEVIISNRIQGDGGDIGKELIDSLTNMVDRSLAA